jgi:hypothetical protein
VRRSREAAVPSACPSGHVHVLLKEIETWYRILRGPSRCRVYLFEEFKIEGRSIPMVRMHHRLMVGYEIEGISYNRV